MLFATGIRSSADALWSAQAAKPRRNNSCLALTMSTPSLRGHEIRFALLVGVAVAERQLPRRVPLRLDLQVLLQVLAELWSGRFVAAVKLQLPRVAREEPERHA